MTVLFVCVHNAGRSQMAEAWLNHLARERGIAVRGVSAGTLGGKEINPVAKEAMLECGISMENHVPKLLSQELIAEADQIISMGCGVDATACPAQFLITEDWGLDDPANQGLEAVREIRDQIKQHVEKLLSSYLAT